MINEIKDIRTVLETLIRPEVTIKAVGLNTFTGLNGEALIQFYCTTKIHYDERYNPTITFNPKHTIKEAKTEALEELYALSDSSKNSQLSTKFSTKEYNIYKLIFK